MEVTRSGAPDVMLVALVTSPVLAVKVPVGTKLKAVLMGIAQAEEALKATTAITALRTAFLRENKLMMISSAEYGAAPASSPSPSYNLP